MEIIDNKITVELKERDINALKLAMTITNQDLDAYLKRAIKRFVYEASREYAGDARFGAFNRDDRDELLRSQDRNIRTRLSDEELRDRAFRRIDRWARGGNGACFDIICAFFKVYDRTEDHKVLRDDMEKEFVLYSRPQFLRPESIDNSRRFINNFRMMCSDGTTAYGAIFKFVNGYVEFFDDKMKDYASKYKDKFVFNNANN